MSQGPYLGPTSAGMKTWPGTQTSCQPPSAASFAYIYVDEEGATVRIHADLNWLVSAAQCSRIYTEEIQDLSRIALQTGVRIIPSNVTINT